MRRFLGWLLALLLVAGVGVVAAAFLLDDRLRAEASDRVSSDLKQSVPFTVEPTVTIEGYPFAWYLLQRRFPGVRVQGAQMPIAVDEQTTLPLYMVDFTLTDVTLGDHETRAATLAGTGRLAYADLESLAGVRIAHAGGDRIALERDVEVVGLTFTGRLTGGAAVDPSTGEITLRDPQLDLAGVRVPASATQAIVDQVAQPVAVPLPYGLRLEAVTPAEDGLHVHVNGTDVAFPVQ